MIDLCAKRVRLGAVLPHQRRGEVSSADRGELPRPNGLLREQVICFYQQCGSRRSWGTSSDAPKTRICAALIACCCSSTCNCESDLWLVAVESGAFLRQQLFVYRDLWVWIDQLFQAPDLSQSRLGAGCNVLAVVGRRPTSLNSKSVIKLTIPGSAI